MYVPDYSTSSFFLKTYKWNYPHAYGGGKVWLHPLLILTPDGGERSAMWPDCLPAEKSPVIPRQQYAWRSSESVRTLWKINIFACARKHDSSFIHPIALSLYWAPQFHKNTTYQTPALVPSPFHIKNYGTYATGSFGWTTNRDKGFTYILTHTFISRKSISVSQSFTWTSPNLVE